MNSRIVLGLLGFLLIAVLAYQTQDMWNPTPRVQQAIALSEGEVLVHAEDSVREQHRIWLSLQSTEGLRWVHRLPADSLSLSRDSIASDAERVTYLRYRTDEVMEVVALSRETGETLWLSELGQSASREKSALLRINAQIHEGLLLLPTNNDELRMLSAEDGEALWVRQIDRFSRLLSWSDEELWLDNNNNVIEALTPRDGHTRRRLHHEYDHCLIDGVLYTLRDGVLSERLEDDTLQTIVTLPTADRLMVQACGRYQDALILAGIDHLNHQTRLIKVPQSKEPAVLSFNFTAQFFDQINNLNTQLAAHHPLKGELTRYVPLVFGMSTRSDGSNLVIIDLETMTIIQEVAHDRYSFMEQFQVGTTHYFYSTDLLFAIDGTTGTLSGATSGGPDVTPSSIQDGQLWLADEWALDAQPLRHPPVVLLDAATLEVEGRLGESRAFPSQTGAVPELSGR